MPWRYLQKFTSLCQDVGLHPGCQVHIQPPLWESESPVNDSSSLHQNHQTVTTPRGLIWVRWQLDHHLILPDMLDTNPWPLHASTWLPKASFSAYGFVKGSTNNTGLVNSILPNVSICIFTKHLIVKKKEYRIECKVKTITHNKWNQIPNHAEFICLTLGVQNSCKQHTKAYKTLSEFRRR